MNQNRFLQDTQSVYPGHYAGQHLHVRPGFHHSNYTRQLHAQPRLPTVRAGVHAASVGIEVLVAVSAATTLAIDFAHRSGITLVGFGRPGRHNVYTFEQRIQDQENGRQ